MFSWAGGSRLEKAKFCFKNYKNTINLFFLIIKHADSQFSEVCCEKFFKSVIKNTKRRADLLTASGARRSCSGKQRPANLLYTRHKGDASNMNDILQIIVN